MKNNDMKILVLCTGNSCRSQMAEGFLRYYLKKMGLATAAANVCSAGLEPSRVNPNAVKVMAEKRIDISKHVSKHLNRFINEEFHYIITVCDNAAAHCPVFPGKGVRLHWPFKDPAKANGTKEEILDEFRLVRNEIESKIKNWLRLELELDRS